MIFQPFQKFYSRSKRLCNELSTSEISGSFGDLGTLIPLLVTLSRQRTVLLAPALFFAGLSNLITGYTWDVPMCVQPMKSIAAVAIADQLSQNEVTTAGIWMGGFMLVIGISGLIEFVNKIITENVVSGIQVGVGVRLAGKGLKMVQDLGWLGRQKYATETTDGTIVSTSSEMNADSILLAVICSLFVLYWLRVNNKNSEQIKDKNQIKENDTKSNRFSLKRLICCYKTNDSKEFQHPVGLYLFLIGIIFATITLATTKNENNQYDLPLTFFGAPVAVWALETVTANDWKVGLLEGAVPQLPLTTLNSVISVCALASALYPLSDLNCNNDDNNNDNSVPQNKGKHIPSRREVSISVGLINLLFCPFGSMPNCHGAGGLAAQHRLGARHGASVAFLGIGKMLLAIFLGGSALTLLDALPESILGVMLVIAGIELCVTGFVFLVNSSFKMTNRKQTIYEEEQTKKKENLTLHSTDEESDEITFNEEQQLPTVQFSSSPDWENMKKEYLRRDTVVTVVTASVIITLGKTHYGALSGWLTHLIYNDGWSDLLNSIQNCFKTDKKKQKGQYVSSN